MKIKYWADFECPFCFISETNLKEAIKELGLHDIEYEPKAYELDPNASKHYTKSIQEKFEQEEGMSKKEAEDRFTRIHRLAEEANLHFDFRTMRYTNSLDAHRLFKFAQDKNLGEVIEPMIFDAYFLEGKELSNRETLLEIAQKAGLNRREVNDMLDSDQYIEAVRKDEKQADILEIDSVPYFVIGNQIVPGFHTKKEFIEILKNNAASDIQAGASCSPTHCD